MQIEFGESEFVIPSRPGVTVPYSSIHSIVRIRRSTIVGRHRSRPVRLSAGAGDELRRHIGDEQLAAIEARERLFWRLLRPPWFILSLAALYALIHWFGAQTGTEIPGAFIGRLIEDGEWFRLVSSGFVHADLDHLASNLRTLIAFGWLLGAAIGVPRMLILLFASEVVSTLFVLAALNVGFGSPFTQVVGSSGGAFGLMGASFFVLVFRRQDIPVGFRALSIPLLLFAVVDLFFTWLGWSSWGLGEVAHLSGSLTGIAIIAFFLRGAGRIPLAVNPMARRVVAAIAVVAVVSGGLAIRNARLYGNERLFELMETELAATTLSDEDRTVLASIIADTDPVPDALMRLALDTMQELMGRAPEPDRRLVLARLLYASGESELALDMMRAMWLAKEGADTPVHLANLYAKGEHEVADVQVTGSRIADTAVFEVTLTEATREPSVVHALLHEDGQAGGLIEIYIAGGHRDSRCPISLDTLRGHTVEAQTIKPVWTGPLPPDVKASLCRIAWFHPDVHPQL